MVWDSAIEEELENNSKLPKIDTQSCSWCSNQAIKYLLGQLLCGDCCVKFLSLHTEFTIRKKKQ